MSEELRKIKISVGSVNLQVEIKNNKTADQLYDALPVEAPINMWGEEFFIKIPGVKDYREVATTKVKIGDVAFWGAGEVLAVFFGRTPMSFGPDPVPADRVNVIGKVIGDATQFREAIGATTMKIEKV